MFQRFQSLLVAFLFIVVSSPAPSFAQDTWIRIGTHTFDAAAEIAGITLDGTIGGSAIRLEARKGKVLMRAVVVTYGRGRVHVEERPIVLDAGERTRPIQLSAKNEPIRGLEIVLAPGGSGNVTLEVWALSTPQPVAARPTGPLPTSAPGVDPTPKLERDPATGEAIIGKTDTGMVGFDQKTIAVGKNTGLETITLEAKDRAVTVDQVKVTYADGKEDTVPIKERLDAGQKRKIAIPRTAPVSNIAIRARSRLIDSKAVNKGTGAIAVTGQTIEPAWPASTAAKTRGLGGGGSRSERGYSYSLETLDACVMAKTCTPVPVFFGTNRKQAEAGGRITFGTDRASSIQLGRVFVTVPGNNRAKGELSVPGTLDWIRGTPEGGDPKRHFTIPKAGITLYPNESEFVAAVKEHVASGVGTHKDHAFVYVHGYRTPWEFAAMRTAQIAYDLSPDDAPFGTPFLYSWPSQAAILDYATDLEVSRISTPHLVGFLRTVVEKTGAAHVHVIAHSMGNVPVMNALAEISRTAPGVKFSQVVLAAPDVEKQEFADLAKDVVNVAKGVTLYASSSDIALLISRLVRRDKARAGDAKDPPGPSIVDGIDTVDISRLATGFMSYMSWNHDKYADSPVLLNDIYTLFRTGERPPNERNISFRPKSLGTVQARFWRFQE